MLKLSCTIRPRTPIKNITGGKILSQNMPKQAFSVTF